MSVPCYHLTLRAGRGDRFTPAINAGQLHIPVAMDGAAGTPRELVNESVWDSLVDAGLSPTQEAIDFFRFATAAYCADLLVPHSTAFDRWSRDITLHLPVANRPAFEKSRAVLEDLLCFLTGDHWTLNFREQAVGRPPRTRRKIRGSVLDADCVSLFSGGLDSAIGAETLLNNGEAPVLVSHNSKSGGAVFSSPAQRAVLAAIESHCPLRPHLHLRFRVNPPAPTPGLSESVTTTRGRSLMFIALGILAASALDRTRASDHAPLVIPENGLISLNVPLTRARLGSWSTRTTHPHTIATVQAALRALGISTPITTPFALMTKGEMLMSTASRDIGLAQSLMKVSVSCAHPNQSRFLPPGQRHPHCGTCVPCIIRRAAAHHAGVDIGGYSYDLPADLGALQPARARDVLAFIYACRSRRRPARATDIAVSGPLHTTDEYHLRSLVRVFEAGMDEVARFLRVKST